MEHLQNSQDQQIHVTREVTLFGQSIRFQWLTILALPGYVEAAGDMRKMVVPKAIRQVSKEVASDAGSLLENLLNPREPPEVSTEWGIGFWLWLKNIYQTGLPW